MKYLGIVGSLRTGSFNQMILHAVSGMLPAGDEFEEFDIGTLPFYNQDLETDFPAAARTLKEKIRAADALIIATPEFNRTMPGVLKNALEWASRPHGDNAWEGKKVMVIGASSGNISTALAQYDLKRVLLYLNARFEGQPEVMIGTVQDKFDGSGTLTDLATKAFLEKSVASFAAFAGK